jgi:hypothetical protein
MRITAPDGDKGRLCCGKNGRSESFGARAFTLSGAMDLATISRALTAFARPRVSPKALKRT